MRPRRRPAIFGEHDRLLPKDKDGFEGHEPRSITIIGRSREIQDEFDRRRPRCDHPEIEVVTCDELTTSADRRRILISS